MNIKNKFNQLKKIAKKFDLELLILFGSVAKKTNNKNSDIDFAYLNSKEINEKELFFEIVKVLNTDNIDLVQISNSNSVELNWNIFKDGIKIYEKKNGLFSENLGNSFINYIDFKNNLKIRDKIFKEKLEKINTSNFNKKIII